MKNLWIGLRITNKQATQLEKAGMLDFSASVDDAELLGRKFKYPQDVTGGFIKDADQLPVAWARKEDLR